MKILIAWVAPVVGNNGGMENVFINFANEMANRGHKVTLLYCTELSGEFCKPVDHRVKLINLVDFIPGHQFESLKKSIVFKFKREFFRIICPSSMRNLKTIVAIRQLQSPMETTLKMENPDVIISMEHGTTTIIRNSDKDEEYPLITMSHFDANTILKTASKIDINTLSSCDAIQALMPEDLKLFNKALPNTFSVRIPNIVPQYDIGKSSHRLPVIIDVARLDKKQKRQHLLLEAFAKISEQFPQWKVELWGEEQNGEIYTRKLQEIIQKHDLEGHVKLCGRYR